MAYSVRHRERARVELEECRGSYPEFAADLDQIVGRLAAHAEKRGNPISLDLQSVIEGGLNVASNSSGDSWKRSLEKWREASFQQKAKMLLATVKKMCPPWETRVFKATLNFLGIRAWDVVIYYEIDHSDERIIITKYDGLPGGLH